MIPGHFRRLNIRVTLTEKSPSRLAGFSDISELLEQKPRRSGAETLPLRHHGEHENTQQGRASEKFMTCEGAVADVLTQI